jgi:hypothetical protein
MRRANVLVDKLGIAMLDLAARFRWGSMARRLAIDLFLFTARVLKWRGAA